jgi:threonine dehydrogenase-like Zn-dependent dehydrogenase
VSISGVYGGALDPMPMLEMFDKGLQLRMGQCNVRRWTEELLTIANASDDPLGLEALATHHLPLSQAPDAYRMFQEKTDGCLKVVLDPAA